MRVRKVPTEQFEQLLQRFRTRGLIDAACPRIALFSRIPGEGVTTVVCGFARRFVEREGGSVLVIDGAGEGRRASELLGAEPGAESASGETVSAHRTGIEGVDLLTLQEGKVSALSANEIEAIAAGYECVLLDAGAWSSGMPHQYMDMCNHSVLVIDGAMTNRDALAQFRVDLEGTGRALSGFVMNRRDYAVPGFIYRMVS